MTIKWVKVDPLVMNGEPFCYGIAADGPPAARAARQRLRPDPSLIKDHPELKRVGIAAAYAYAADHRERYAEFFEPDGSLAGPGYTRPRRRGCRAQYRVPGIVVKTVAPATDAA